MRFSDLCDEILFLQVDCPTCCAKPGQYCTSDRPGESALHASRKRARKAVGRNQTSSDSTANEEVK